MSKRKRCVALPAAYRLSSYRENAQGEENVLVQPHALYQALAGDTGEHWRAYHELFRFQLAPGLVDEIRAASNGNFALGNARFAKQSRLRRRWGDAFSPARRGGRARRTLRHHQSDRDGRCHAVRAMANALLRSARYQGIHRQIMVHSDA